MKDDLGKRMKENYEMRTRVFLPRRTYTIIRLDGKAFHTFTKGMNRPYDKDFMDIMNFTTIKLCEEIQGVKLAYTQSDEISLLLCDFDKITTDAWFDGNIQKIVSVSASIATGYFNQKFYDTQLNKKWNKYQGDANKYAHAMKVPLAFFDARVYTIPDPIEVENYFVWRQKDTVRNSISMHAQSLYSHKELDKKTQSDMQEMIHQKGENWNNLPDGFKRGRTIYKDIIERDKDGLIKRVDWVIHYPDFLKLNDYQEREISGLIPKYNYA